jgi:hypothetical protein
MSWNGTHIEGNELIGTLFQAFETFRGSSNYKNYGITCLFPGDTG